MLSRKTSSIAFLLPHLVPLVTAPASAAEASPRAGSPTGNLLPNRADILESLAPVQPDQPPSALWRRPPPHSRWDIEVQYTPNPANAQTASDFGRRAKRVTVTHHGRESLVEVQMENGNELEFWNLAGAELRSAKDQADVSVRPTRRRTNGVAQQGSRNRNTAPSPPVATQPSILSPEQWTQFSEFDWIQTDHFQGTMQLDGEPVQVFLAPIPQDSVRSGAPWRSAPHGPLAGLPVADGIVAAAISSNTRLPRVLQIGCEIRRYAYTPLAVESLKLPDKVTRFLRILSARTDAKPRPLP